MSETIQKALAAIIFCLFIAAVSFFAGVEYAGKGLAKAEEKQAVALDQKHEEQHSAQDKVVVRYVDKVRTITKEVKVYVPSATNTCTELDGAFRLWYDTAISGGVPASPGSADGASVPVEDLAATEQDNIEGCRKNTAQIEALQTERRAVSK